MDEALQEFQTITDGLPTGIVSGVEKCGRNCIGDTLYTFLCRNGRISDYFDLDSVFEFYGKLGINISSYIINQVKELCNIEIKTFGGEKPPFLY